MNFFVESEYVVIHRTSKSQAELSVQERNAAIKRERPENTEFNGDVQQRPTKFQKSVETVDLTRDSDGDE